MGTFVGVGFSDHRNPAVAGKEAALTALERGGMTRPDFVFVFATVGYRQQLLISAIREATSGAPLCGCSGEGIITQETVTETNFGVAVMAISSDELRFDHVFVAGLENVAGAAGERLAAEVTPFLAPDNLACLLFADGLAFNSEPFFSAFEGSLSKPLPLFGGLAGDNWSSRKTYQYYDDQVISGGLSCVVLSGRGKFASGVNHGCVPVGSKRTITRGEGNVIREIDGIPALDALKDYFEDDWESEWSKTSLNLCLGFPTPDAIKGGYEEHIIRYMIDKDDGNGSVTIQSEARDGSDVWIVRRDKELIREGLQAIADSIRNAVGDNKVKFILQFECVGRGKVVFREQEKVALIRTLQEEVGSDIPWLGFYSYGEIGPVKELNCFHNFTSIVVAVY
jgi:hypothetical protein